MWKRTALICTAILGVTTFITVLRRERRRKRSERLRRAEDELHPLLKDHTTFQSYTTQYATYPSIRTFYRPHEHVNKHDDLKGLPLLVFVHGLGGVLPQFAPTIGSLSNVAACFAIELAGHGRSAFEPKKFQAYKLEANVALWKQAIESICKEHSHKSVVLIGHSMGCSLAALLASSHDKEQSLNIPVLGLVAMCPRARQFTSHDIKAARRLFSLPDAIINVLRWFDRLGGSHSNSVNRVVGSSDEGELRFMQLAWNRQFSTSVLRRETLGLLPEVLTSGEIVGGWPGKEVWSNVDSPIFLIAGKDDTVCQPTELDRLLEHMLDEDVHQPVSTADDHLAIRPAESALTPKTFNTKSSVAQTIVLPSPAAHALPYAHATYRLVSALIETFLSEHVSDKLDFAYQLRLLTTTGKWDVKNLEKWQKVLPVSGPIHIQDDVNGLFRALKTLRQQDDEHNPSKFLQEWADIIYCIIDISHDAPIYDTKEVEKGGVEYHKFPTVSKIPPTQSEVHDFCSLVDRLVQERDRKGDNRSIGVHCHYGYNRTGYFIVSYLILKKGYDIQSAIDEFGQAKPPGIRHDHFIDTLWLRYSGLQR